MDAVDAVDAEVEDSSIKCVLYVGFSLVLIVITAIYPIYPTIVPPYQIHPFR